MTDSNGTTMPRRPSTFVVQVKTNDDLWLDAQSFQTMKAARDFIRADEEGDCETVYRIVSLRDQLRKVVRTSVSLAGV